MTKTIEDRDTKQVVVSPDGTEIAYWTSGKGRPLLLVHGTTGDHTRWAPLLPHLEPHATVTRIDRRGRGQSGDAPDYAAEREFEDVAAVVDEVARTTGSTVDVYGHSYGGMVVLGAALLTSNIGKLVLYEPVLDGDAVGYPDDFLDELDALVSAGKREEAVETFFREILGMSGSELEAFKALPSWPARVAAAHTVSRECRAECDHPFRVERARDITVPTLMLKGSESPAFLQADTDAVAAALPDVRVVVLDGQEHIADVYVPDVFAGHVLSFLDEGR